MKVTRGFVGKRRQPADRVPPGQYDTGSGWPVLTAEATPRIEPEQKAELHAIKQPRKEVKVQAKELDGGGARGPRAVTDD